MWASHCCCTSQYRKRRRGPSNTNYLNDSDVLLRPGMRNDNLVQANMKGSASFHAGGVVQLEPEGKRRKRRVLVAHLILVLTK